MKAKFAIVVGASSGIGREVALQFLSMGLTVGLAARRVDKLRELEALAPELVRVKPIDVCDEGAAEQLNELIAETGGMDIYFHAAGIGKENRVLDPEIELATVKTNVVGFTRMVDAAFMYMSEHGQGHIVCISSIAGTRGLGPAPSYSASKSFQQHYMQALEQQSNRRKLGICFTDIRPGFVDTPLLAGANGYPMQMQPDLVAKAIVRAVFKRRHVVVMDARWRIVTALWHLLPRAVWRHFPI